MDELLAAAPDWLVSPSGTIALALGIVVLLFGRRLFWLLVAVVGFFIGVLLVDTLLTTDAETTRWIVGLLVGLAAALLAVLLQRMAVGLAGALIAGYTTFWYLDLSGQPLETWHWLLVVVAAVAGLLIARAVFDFGLILLSSLAGATMILEGLQVEAEVSRWAFLGLVIVGAAIQTAGLGRRGRRRKRGKSRA